MKQQEQEPSEVQKMMITAKTFDKDAKLEFRNNFNGWIITFVYQNIPYFISCADKTIHKDVLKDKKKRVAVYPKVKEKDLVKFKTFYEVPFGKTFGNALQNDITI